MIPRLPVRVTVLSNNSKFKNRLITMEKIGQGEFCFHFSPEGSLNDDLYLVDYDYLSLFLETHKSMPVPKFIVHGRLQDLANAFNAGCDDFLKDPWNNEELEIRILKITKEILPFIIWDNLKLYPTHITFEDYSENVSIEEFIILKRLIENRGTPVPREVLLYSLWGTYQQGSRTVDMHISNIRKKIFNLYIKGESPGKEIITVRNYGYLIN